VSSAHLTVSEFGTRCRVRRRGVERIRGSDRWNLSSSPPCGRAVRGSMKFSKKIRAVEISGRDPRVFVITVASPVDQVLRVTTMETETNDLIDFVFDMAVRKLDWSGDDGRAVEMSIGMVGTEKFGMEGIVNTAVDHRGWKVEAICDSIDTGRNGKGTAKLGHEFARTGIRVGSYMTCRKEDKVANSEVAGAAMAIGLSGCVLVCANNGSVSSIDCGMNVLNKVGSSGVGRRNHTERGAVGFQAICEIKW
jgi:hypothetical protein